MSKVDVSNSDCTDPSTVVLTREEALKLALATYEAREECLKAELARLKTKSAEQITELTDKYAALALKYDVVTDKFLDMQRARDRLQIELDSEKSSARGAQSFHEKSNLMWIEHCNKRNIECERLRDELAWVMQYAGDTKCSDTYAKRLEQIYSRVEAALSASARQVSGLCGRHRDRRQGLRGRWLRRAGIRLPKVQWHGSDEAMTAWKCPYCCDDKFDRVGPSHVHCRGCARVFDLSQIYRAKEA